MAQQESTLPLVIAGTAAVHLLIAVAIDFASVTWRDDDDEEPETLSLIDIDTSKIPPPEPDPPPEVAPEEPPVAPPPVETPQVQPRQTRAPRTARTEVPPPSTPLPPADPSPNAGGGQVVNLPGIAPAARGVAVGSGKPQTGKLGRGGKGGGGGAGDGAGDGPGTAPVVASISSIKTPAEPKEGFDYFDAAKSYPPAARRLGIEGKLRVRLTVDVNGKVVGVKLLGSLGHGLDELALARARAIQFTPALDANDRPMTSWVVWTFTFTLPSDT